MSHPEQQKFVELVKSLNLSKVSSSRVLEVGSCDVFGSIRKIFPECVDYIGIDLSPGPGVDIVLNAHDLKTLNGGFDLVLCCEVLEHDPMWEITVRSILDVLNPGGLVILTCATTGRPEHGTRRTNPAESPGSQAMGWDHYSNVGENEFKDCVISAPGNFRAHTWTNPKIFDLYAMVFCEDETQSEIVVPSTMQISGIIKSTPLRYQIARWPIRIIIRLLGVDMGEKFGRLWWTALSKRTQLIRGTRLSEMD